MHDGVTSELELEWKGEMKFSIVFSEVRKWDENMLYTVCIPNSTLYLNRLKYRNKDHLNVRILLGKEHFRFG